MRHKLNLIGIGLICLFQAACGCFCVTGIRWGITPTVPMSLAAAALFPPNFQQEFVAAEGTWTLSSAGFFVFTLGPPSPGGFSLTPNGVNDVDFLFAPALGLPQDTLGATAVIASDLFGCGILEVDMFYNSVPLGVWDSSGVPQAGHFAIQTVVLHELGHVLQLDHVSCPDDSIMLPGYNLISQNFSRVQRNLSGCDIAGINLIYIAQSPPCLPLAGFCFFGSVLGSDYTGDDQIVLNSEYATMASTHQEEVLEITAGDPQLMYDATALGWEYQPVLMQLMEKDPAVADRKIEDKDIKNANKLLDRLRKNASTKLKEDIDKVKKRVHDLEGHSAAEAFATALTVFKAPKPQKNPQ